MVVMHVSFASPRTAFSNDFRDARHHKAHKAGIRQPDRTEQHRIDRTLQPGRTGQNWAARLNRAKQAEQDSQAE